MGRRTRGWTLLGATALIGWGLGCSGAVDVPDDDPVAEEEDDEVAEAEPEPEPEPTDEEPPPDDDVAWPEDAATLADGARVWVAEVARPGNGMPEDAEAGLIVPAQTGWDDVPEGVVLRAITADGTEREAVYRGVRSIPYGCDGGEQPFAFFEVEDALDVPGEVAMIRTAGPPLVGHEVKLTWRDDGYRTQVAGLPVGVKATGDQTGSLRIGKGGGGGGAKGKAKGKGKSKEGGGEGHILRVPFEKYFMDGLDEADQKLDVTLDYGDVSVPLLKGALGSSNQVALAFRARSWEGVNYTIYGVEDGKMPVELGTQYVYVCAF